MIPVTLRVTLIIAVCFYFIFILHYLKNKMLELKYTLIWLAAGFVMILLIAFPELLMTFVAVFGIESNMNGLYILVFAFVITTLMTLTSIVSRQNLKIRILIQELSIMEKRIRELESMEQGKKKKN